MLQHIALRAVLPAAIVAQLAPRAAVAQAVISPDSLRRTIAVIADDSMQGRATLSRGNYLTAGYVADAFRRYGLEPAGDSGGFFQAVTVRLRRPVADSVARRWPARNVVGIVRGGDPALRETYVAISAHNDHLGLARTPVDHDSIRAYDRVVRQEGADSPNRPATPDEQVRIRALLDSTRALRPPRADSIYNGADDDGSGTAALVELARVLSRGPRPRRSILLVSHAAEEPGLLGSRWYTDHPTVPLDSIVGEIDVDMIARGDPGDVPRGGPGYVEIVGSRRLSHRFGDLLDSVNARQPRPFAFNYAFDAPGDPAQYYCRADHYSYARFGIPSVSVSTGLHPDYHQVTDEPQYLDYPKLARVTRLTRDFALAVANLRVRPVVDGPRTDPHAPCRQ